MAIKRAKRQPARRPKAVTADIVGSAHRAEPVPAKWRKHYNRLVELRSLLMSRQNDLVKDANEEQPAFSLHMADAGTDSFDRDFALSRISSEQDAVYEIEEALDRIQNGAYGICEATGKPIEARRLEAIPWTRFSAAAEKELEKQGAVRRARLSPREPMARGGGAEGEAEESADSEQGDEE